MRTDIRHSIRIGMTVLLMTMGVHAVYAQRAAGTTADRATRVTAPTTLTVQSGSNYIRLASDHLPATVTYVADTAFGPMPMALVTGDTLEAKIVFDTCHMAWKWSIEEAEVDKIVEIKAHENATIMVDPRVCATSSEVTEEACDSLFWNGEWRKTTGDHTYKTVNAAGCDSTVTLHLTIHHPTSSEVTEEACDSLLWNGEWRKSSGDYEYKTLNANGCDSIAVLHLTIHHSYTIPLSDTTVCETEMKAGYVWRDAVKGDTVIHHSGTYSRGFKSITGCDSIVTQKVTILQPSYGDGAIDITAYDSYTTELGMTYKKSSAGVIDYLENAVGCDSIVTLNLTIRHLQVRDTFTRTLCASELPYTWFDKICTESGIYSSDTIHGQAVDGVYMDTVHSVNLTVLPTSQSEAFESACNSFQWYDQTYTASGDYSHVHPGANRYECDSTEILHLTIYTPTEGDSVAAACDSFAWYGETYKESGDYTHLMKGANAHGCDSTVTLHLTINHPSEGETSLEVCNSYEQHGQVYTKSGDYTFTITNVAGCDSVVTLHLTVINCDLVYDTVYFCTGQNTPHEEVLDEVHIRRYLAYTYESPANWDYMEGVIIAEEHDRMQVDLRRAEQNLYAHYTGELTPVKSILWSYRAHGATGYQKLEVKDEPQWIETGTVAITIRFLCGQLYSSDFETDVVTVRDEREGRGQKILQNGQIMIIRNGIKYNILGTKIE